MARSALCVGINEFKSLPMSSWLSGCVNDANDISKALQEVRLHRRARPRCSRDSEATKKTVMGALTAMVDKAKPGDHLVFSFSSHGTQVPNQPGDHGRARRPRRGLRLLRHQAGWRPVGPQHRHRRRRAA